MPVLLTFALFFLLTVSAHAADDGWKPYYSSDDGAGYFFDAQSIVRTTKKVTGAPAKAVVPGTRNKVTGRPHKTVSHVRRVKVRQKIVFGEAEREVRESRVMSEFDCANKKVRSLMMTRIYRNGSKSVEGKTGPWRDVGTEPFSTRLYAIVCTSQ